LNVLFLTPGSNLPSTRYRVLQYIPWIERNGARVTTAVAPSGWFARWRLFREAEAYDVVVLQKRLMVPWFVGRLRKHARRLVYDFDDAVLFGSSSKGGIASASRSRRFRATVGAADLVIAGNDYLGELAAPHARRTVVIPTAVDPAKYDAAAVARTRDDAVVKLGWIGGKSTVAYLDLVRGALETIGAAHDCARLKVVSDAFPKLRSLPVEAKSWAEADEAADVADFDIGLAPLTDDLWARGKCGLKTLQYMAASKPVVCSPVGVQREMVRPGLSGLWATSRQEWVEALAQLIRAPEERARMGAAGRKILNERYSLARNAPAFVEAVCGRA
jgi:glycosyltransferase involved in cell wall biosynthesis